MSAFGGKADIDKRGADVRFWPKADMSGAGLLPCKQTPVEATLIRADRRGSWCVTSHTARSAGASSGQMRTRSAHTVLTVQLSDFA